MSYDEVYVNTLVVHMNDILNSVVQTFGQANVELPARRYIAAGQTAHDCEQVTVSLSQLYIGPPGDQAQEPQRCEAPRSAVVLVEIVRCIPSMNTRTGEVDVTALQAVAETQARDAWMLLEAATNMDVYGILGDVTPTDPQGKYQAITLTLTMVV